MFLRLSAHDPGDSSSFGHALIKSFNHDKVGAVVPKDPQQRVYGKICKAALFEDRQVILGGRRHDRRAGTSINPSILSSLVQPKVFIMDMFDYPYPEAR